MLKSNAYVVVSAFLSVISLISCIDFGKRLLTVCNSFIFSNELLVAILISSAVNLSAKKSEVPLIISDCQLCVVVVFISLCSIGNVSLLN